MSVRTLLPNQIASGLIINPLTIENANLYRSVTDGVNYYAILTNFYANALWGQYPEGNQADELLLAFERATIQRSVNGVGVVMVQGDRYESWDTRYYWALRDPDSGAVIGHVVMCPYATNAQALPDRIRVVVWREGTSSLQVTNWAFSGVTIGAMISAADVTGYLLPFGDGVDDYTNVKYLITELNKRLNKNSSLLDRHSSPHLQGPSSALATDADGNSKFNISEEGGYLPSDSQDSEFRYLTWDASAPLAQYQVDRVIDLLHLQTGIPATAFGLPNQGGSSGVSLERQMFAALSKVRRLRREIERAANILGQSEFIWPNDPFASFNDNVQAEIALVNAGITTPQSSRRRLLIEADGPTTQGGNGSDDSERTEPQ